MLTVRLLSLFLKGCALLHQLYCCLSYAFINTRGSIWPKEWFRDGEGGWVSAWSYLVKLMAELSRELRTTECFSIFSMLIPLSWPSWQKDFLNAHGSEWNFTNLLWSSCVFTVICTWVLFGFYLFYRFSMSLFTCPIRSNL